MTRGFKAPMPKGRPGQKHASPKVSDNYGYLASLRGNAGADVNWQWYWNDLEHKDEEHGGEAFGAHYKDPGRNGYTHIYDTHRKRMRALTPHELRSVDWTAEQVRHWRRGHTRRHARPHTVGEMLHYVRVHGGTIIGELKSTSFAHDWVMQQMLETYHRHNHAPWFKALADMAEAEGKCAATRRAHVGGVHGQFALIFGEKIHGHAARQTAGKRITASWDIKPNSIW